MRHLTLPLLLVVSACGPTPDADDDTDVPTLFDGAMPDLRGPGGPATTFTDEQLFVNCAPLDAGVTDTFKHHNEVMPYRGHLVMPWAPEWGRGGLTFFDMHDPCSPVVAGEGLSESMRETHAIGFMHFPEGDAHAGDWAVTNMTGFTEEAGIQFWDITDVAAPVATTRLALPEVRYPDSYTKISLSVYWQYPWVYVAAADNGVFVVDATDPTAPTVVGHYLFPNGLRAGGVFPMGDSLFVSSAEGEQAGMLDVSDPTQPMLMPGSPFGVVNRDGELRESYHANRVGPWALFARKEGGGGPIVMDISDPTKPTFVSDLPVSGNGGYVYYDEGFLFTGDSDIAHVIDATDITDLKEVQTGDLPGDLDTMTPFGNVAILSVDEPDYSLPDVHGSVVMPWTKDPDTTGPLVLHTEPRDGQTGVSTSGKLGVGFNEFVEPTSAYLGSLRLHAEDGSEIDGWATAQEATASYVTKAPLEPGTTYTLEITKGGVADINGNTVAETVTVTFTTAE